MTDEPARLEPGIAWARNFWSELVPHAESVGSYVNYLVEPDEARVRASYGAAKYARLGSIKAKYDPDNLFHLNANIRPGEFTRGPLLSQ
jgi:FAD/FMN-containing dehydrogenase